jgi:hypothetical protein
MRLLKRTVPALIALLMLGLAAAPIAAQTPVGDGGTQIENLEGLQRAYSRTYTADMMAMFNIATPDAMPSGWFALTTMVLEFDNADNAKAGNDLLIKDVESTDMTDTGTTLEDATLNVDYDYTAKQAIATEQGMTTHILVATSQDDKYIYAVVGITFGDDPADVVASTLTSLRDTKAGDGDGTFHDDGTSSGGLWDKLPALEQAQAQVPALVEAMDEILFPVQDGTPAA